jgi:pyrroloquinoline quinone biosynthesis protein D
MSIQAGRRRARSNPQVLAGKASVMTPELNSRPYLAVGCRLNEKSQPSRVLHMPERALRLNGPSLEIIERCDGKRTVREIISELQKLYSKAEPEKVEADILGYLARLHDQRALDFTSDRADRSADTK